MDLEQMTKHQIVLLTLLVSFMTSIATGIITVSLMEQAPPSIPRTINQIVEHTVEKVVPSTQGAMAAATTIKTVVVKDDDLAAQSIASTQKAIIRIVGKGSDQLLARGVMVDKEGSALTDKQALLDSGYSQFEAILASDERVAVSLVKGQNASSTIALVSVSVGTSTGFLPAALADTSKLKLGSRVIRIGGTGTDIVGEGIIAALPTKDSDLVQTSVTSATPGSIIITLFGEVLGVMTSDSSQYGPTFYTLSSIPSVVVSPKPASGS